jgi:hypothetical protein
MKSAEAETGALRASETGIGGERKNGGRRRGADVVVQRGG